jgi:glycosyltransferase involved in cell wall biosynthesis
MLISIIVPVFNLEGYVSHCLQSVFLQDLSSVEIIIVNDGSNDGSLEEIQSTINRLVPVNIQVLTTVNKGVSSARNLGLKTARGDYVYFLDGDDIVTCDFLETVKSKLLTCLPEMLIFGFNKTTPDLQVLQRYEDRFSYPEKFVSSYELLDRRLDDKILVCVGTVIYKREVLLDRELWLHEDTKYGEDLELLLKYISCVDEIVVVDKVLVNYIQRPLSAMNNKKKMQYDSIYSLERVAEFWEQNSFDQHFIKKLRSVFIPIALLRMAMEAVQKNIPVDSDTLIRKDMVSRLTSVAFGQFKGRRLIHYFLLKVLKGYPWLFSLLMRVK